MKLTYIWIILNFKIKADKGSSTDGFLNTSVLFHGFKPFTGGTSSGEGKNQL